MRLLQEAIPQTPEAWAFYTLVFGAITGAIGAAFKRWADRKVERETAASTALTTAQQRLVEAAERREREANERADTREETSNRRMDAALQGMAQLTQVTTELSTINKTMLEELRRANANYEALSRQRAR